ncbi:Uncharacterised protein [Mycobacteroides abscessus subsp. abscessus]|nr:Uncharacterised protein [Mycobacteroides abscessus subsp. abscessus]
MLFEPAQVCVTQCVIEIRRDQLDHVAARQLQFVGDEFVSHRDTPPAQPAGRRAHDAAARVD